LAATAVRRSFCALSALARHGLPTRARHHLLPGVLAACLLTGTTGDVCAAEEPSPADPDEPAGRKTSGTAEATDGDGLTKRDYELYRRLSRPRGGYGRLLLGLAFGRGLRFNNPYRLRSQLGDTPESLSLTATYFDGSIAMVFGDPYGLQHGPAVHLAVALEGVPQQALSASYQLLYRGAAPLMGYARLGGAALTSPDFNLGGELALGGAYYFTGALGATAELVGNLFYGAGTWETQYSVIPVLSAQAGLLIDFEVLP